MSLYQLHPYQSSIFRKYEPASQRQRQTQEWLLLDNQNIYLCIPQYDFTGSCFAYKSRVGFDGQRLSCVSCHIKHSLWGPYSLIVLSVLSSSLSWTSLDQRTRQPATDIRGEVSEDGHATLDWGYMVLRTRSTRTSAHPSIQFWANTRYGLGAWGVLLRADTGDYGILDIWISCTLTQHITEQVATVTRV